jgi:surfactin synthase thioesterase subunit
LLYTGLPVGVDEQFIWLGLPAIRSDFSAFESYQLSGGCNDDVKLSCPIVKIAADCDEFVSSQDTDGWNQYSDQYIRYELQGASHFYLSEERCLHALMGILCQEVL